VGERILKIFDKLKVDYILVNATNTWLEETPKVEESAVFSLTGFTGDTGDCLLTKKGECFLFVDGRYHIQADNEVKDWVKVVKLQLGQKQDEEICKKIGKKATFAIVGTKVSVARFENFQKLLSEKKVNFKILSNDVVLDTFSKQKRRDNFLKSFSLKRNFKTGCKPKVFKPKQATFIANLDDVAYLTQRRNFLIKSGASRIYSYLFIEKNGKQKLLKDLKQVERFLKKQNQQIAIDKRGTSIYIASLIKNPVYKSSEVADLRTIKTAEEINALKKAFAVSDKALRKTRDFIETSKEPISEFDICENLKSNFKKYGANGLSFEPIVAINQNSALAHYNKHSKDVFLGNGDIVLIDCGVYCKEGLATDTTRVFVKGKPNELQMEVYTLVLKAFLNAYCEKNKTGFELNKLAHEILDNKIIIAEDKDRNNNRKNKKNDNDIKPREQDYFVFNHGLGHGIGISVHEAPPSLGSSEVAKKSFKNHMCFTIEPGLYHRDFFGIRLENSFYRENGQNITLTKIGFEKKMILFDKLNENEKKALRDFDLI